MTESGSFGDQRIGRACVFLFPFEIHRATAELELIEVEFPDVSIRLYAPFASETDPVKRPALSIVQVPGPPKAPPVSSSLPQIRLKPLSAWKQGSFIANAMRVDIHGTLAETELRARAEREVERFCRLCRLWTRQWWVGRGSAESRAPLRNIFDVDEEGIPSSRSIHEVLHIVPWLGTEALLDARLFQLVCDSLRSGSDASVATMLMFDAVAASASGDLQRAVLDCAIACEALFSEQAQLLVAQGSATRRDVDRVLAFRFRRRLTEGSTILFGRSFAVDHSQAWSDLQSLRRARHALAHGNPEQIARCKEIHDHKSFAQGFAAASDYFDWMAQHRLARFPNPLFAFAGGLIRERHDRRDSTN